MSIQSHPAVDLVSRAFPELDEVVLHETSRRLYQLDLASKSAIVPPIRVRRGNCVAPALVVYFHNQRIRFVAHQIGYFKIERRESALMPPDFFPIEIDVCYIVGRAEIDEDAGVLLALIIKRLLVPDRA